MANGGTKILIIDYEPRGIKQLNDPLEGAGFQVRIAKDGIAGLEAFATDPPDLVLLEAMLPKRNGFEVCQEIKSTERGRHTPVVIVTSVYKGRKYRSQALYQYGSDEFMEKPVDSEQLVSTVVRLLARARTAAATGADLSPGASDNVKTTDASDAEISDHLDQLFGNNRSRGT
jgi:DNA-binding response OmpR family regulator